MAIIHDALPAFDVAEVRAYIESQDAEGTKQAREMIDHINRILFDDVLGALKDKFGRNRRRLVAEGRAQERTQRVRQAIQR